MEVYDYVPAHTVEEGDQILFNNDPVEVSSKLDEGDCVMLKGYSYITGDSVTYFINPDAEVGLWTA